MRGNLLHLTSSRPGTHGQGTSAVDVEFSAGHLHLGQSAADGVHRLIQRSKSTRPHLQLPVLATASAASSTATQSSPATAAARPTNSMFRASRHAWPVVDCRKSATASSWKASTHSVMLDPPATLSAWPMVTYPKSVAASL